MKIRFSEKQMELLRSAGFPFDFHKELSEYEYYLTVEHVGEIILLHGLDEVHEPTEKGLLFGGIMDALCRAS